VQRTVALAALALVVATPALGDAATKPKRVERKVTVDYTGFCQAGIEGNSGGVQGCPNELSDVARKGEAYVKAMVTDETGLSVGLVTYDPDAFAGSTTYSCGAVKAKKIKSGRLIGVKTVANPTCGGVPVTGTLTLVFSNLP
jgi:hypothetical protein